MGNVIFLLILVIFIRSCSMMNARNDLAYQNIYLEINFLLILVIFI